MSLQYKDGGSASDTLTRLSSRPPNMFSFEFDSQEDKEEILRLAPELLPPTPPLRAFDWWQSFAHFNAPEPPAVLSGSLTDSNRRLLAPFGRKINNYEDERIFHNIVAESRQRHQCPSCMIARVIFQAMCYLEIHDKSGQFENFIGATIQELYEWSRLQDHQLVRLLS